jgi:flagellar biosynthetic protein FliO
MNASKNCSDSCLGYSLFGLGKQYLLISLLLVFCVNVSAADQLTTPSSVIEVSDYFTVFLGLAFVIALFLGSTFLFKRFGNGPMLGRGQLRVVDGLHLGNRERLVLVELKDKQILLAITPGRINKLDTIDALSSGEMSSDPALEVDHSSMPTNQSQSVKVTNA